MNQIIKRKFVKKDGTILHRAYTEIRGVPVQDYVRDANRKYRMKVNAQKVQPLEPSGPRTRMSPSKKIPPEIIELIQAEYRAGASLRSIERKFGISRFIITQIVEGNVTQTPEVIWKQPINN